MDLSIRMEVLLAVGDVIVTDVSNARVILRPSD